LNAQKSDEIILDFQDYPEPAFSEVDLNILNQSNLCAPSSYYKSFVSPFAISGPKTE
jgi:hypothetical protein